MIDDDTPPAPDRKSQAVGPGRLHPVARAIVWACVIVPVGATIIGAVTSPPMRGIPEGHLVHLEANDPSEHTTTLRDLLSIGPDGKWHLLAAEQEPQDVDAGSREWISAPTVSPDGTQIAFYKELITLQEEEQALDWQLWVMSIDPKTQAAGKPHEVADLSQDKSARFFGLTWTPDGKEVTLIKGNEFVAYNVASGKSESMDTEPGDARWPVYTHNGTLLALRRVGGTWRVTTVKYGDVGEPSQSTVLEKPQKAGQTDVVSIAIPMSTSVIALTGRASVYAVDRQGQRIAYAPGGTSDKIAIASVDGHLLKTYQVVYGWSLFGGRHVSALRWSPSGRYIAYGVTKPPLGEDELFLLDTIDGRCYKLPYRSGESSWDWSR